MLNLLTGLLGGRNDIVDSRSSQTHPLRSGGILQVVLAVGLVHLALQSIDSVLGTLHDRFHVVQVLDVGKVLVEGSLGIGECLLSVGNGIVGGSLGHLTLTGLVESGHSLLAGSHLGRIVGVGQLAVVPGVLNLLLQGIDSILGSLLGSIHLLAVHIILILVGDSLQSLLSLLDGVGHGLLGVGNSLVGSGLGGSIGVVDGNLYVFTLDGVSLVQILCRETDSSDIDFRLLRQRRIGLDEESENLAAAGKYLIGFLLRRKSHHTRIAVQVRLKRLGTGIEADTCGEALDTGHKLQTLREDNLGLQSVDVALVF